MPIQQWIRKWKVSNGCWKIMKTDQNYSDTYRMPVREECQRRPVNINVTLFSYSKASGDGPCHFEPLSSDEDNT
ncbi:hypothetical protein TNCV_4318071 [Trichonephila clavipes]|nr:hypothetical protein TNCV_4318071 [Trichonephila clavipes]